MYNLLKGNDNGKDNTKELSIAIEDCPFLSKNSKKLLIALLAFETPVPAETLREITNLSKQVVYP